ncbi:hypothetical protein [Nocardia sp. NPDC002869]|uniref:hypothetical protein n=1 Tax=Nocardia sp. NPDC002869 TaxID=3161032 RepID=UPI00398CC14F
MSVAALTAVAAVGSGTDAAQPVSCSRQREVIGRKLKPLNIVPFNNGIVAAAASGVASGRFGSVRFDGSRFDMSNNFFMTFMMMMIMMMMF